MAREGLRVVICVSVLIVLELVLLLLLILFCSTNPDAATEGLQTNETEPKDLPQPQKDLNNRKEKSSTIIPRLPENFSVRISRRRRLKLIMCHWNDCHDWLQRVPASSRTTSPSPGCWHNYHGQLIGQIHSQEKDQEPQEPAFLPDLWLRPCPYNQPLHIFYNLLNQILANFF